MMLTWELRSVKSELLSGREAFLRNFRLSFGPIAFSLSMVGYQEARAGDGRLYARFDEYGN